MRLYTGKGDSGSTDLLGERVEKDDPRIELIGTLDEATSAIGLGRALTVSERVAGWSIEIQRDLYAIMAELAFTDELRPASLALPEARVSFLGNTTDQLSAEIPMPPQFILPGETAASAAIDVARTVVRRAERQSVALAREGNIPNRQILIYLNRLSSLLFMLARAEETEAGVVATRAKPSGWSCGSG